MDIYIYIRNSNTGEREKTLPTVQRAGKQFRIELFRNRQTPLFELVLFCCRSELRSGCAKIEMDVLGSPALIVRMVSVCSFSVALRPQRPYGLSHSTRALGMFIVQCCFTSTETVRTIRDRETTIIANSKHWFTTSSFRGCRKVMLGVCDNR